MKVWKLTPFSYSDRFTVYSGVFVSDFFRRRFRHFHGIPIVLYCIFVILGRVSDAVGRGYVIGTTVDVGVCDADVFRDGGSGSGGAVAGRGRRFRRRFAPF